MVPSWGTAYSSPVSEIENIPFTLTQEEATMERYQIWAFCLIVFILHTVSTLQRPLLPILLTETQVNAARAVAGILANPLPSEEIDGRIHALLFSLYHTTHPERSARPKEDPMFLFFMYLSVNKSGTFDDLGFIASRLSGLFYVMCMVAVKEIFDQAKEMDQPNPEFV